MGSQNGPTKVAVKLLQASHRAECIQHEIMVLKELAAQHELSDVVELIDHGQMENGVFMVTQLLGPNIYELHKFCDFHFSLSTSVKLLVQVIDVVQKLHDTGYVHNDIKPENLVVSLRHPSQIIMIDLGFATRYLDAATGSHIQSG